MVMCYGVLVLSISSFADLFLSINLDPVDLNFHKSGCRYIATLISVVEYHARCGNLGRAASSWLPYVNMAQGSL